MLLKDYRCIIIICFVLFILILSAGVSAHPTDKQNHGFLRTNGRLWQFDDGTPFIPIGISIGGVAFLTQAGAFESKWGMSPDAFFEKLADHGVNYIAAHTNMVEGLNYPEFNPNHRSLAERNLDWFFDELEENGQMVAVGLTHHGEHIYDKLWNWNLYNKAQGGPCDTPDDFVTNPVARLKMKEKIDFFNQFNDYRSFGVWQLSTEWALGGNDGATPNFYNQATTDWHIEMAEYIHAKDAHDHPVSGNLNWMDYHDEVPSNHWWNYKADGIPAWSEQYGKIFGHSSIDYVNIHTYNIDVGFAVQDFYRYGKPILISEGGSRLFEQSYQPGWIGDGMDYLQYLTWASMALWTNAPDWSLWTVRNGSGDNDPVDMDMMGHFDEYCALFETASSFAHNVIIPDWNNWNKSPELWKDRIAGKGKIYASGDGNRVMAYIHSSRGDYTVSGMSDNKYKVQLYDVSSGELILSSKEQGTAITVTIESPGSDVMLYIKPDGADSSVHAGSADSFFLGQNYPNPFNPLTEIRFSIPKAASVYLKVYDTSGRLVRTILKEHLDSGEFTRQWDGNDDRGNPAASGLYLYTLNTPETIITKRMVLLR